MFLYNKHFQFRLVADGPKHCLEVQVLLQVPYTGPAYTWQVAVLGTTVVLCAGMGASGDFPEIPQSSTHHHLLLILITSTQP